MSGQLHAPAGLPPGKSSSGTHWIEGRMGPRVGLDNVVRRKILPLPGLELWPLSRYRLDGRGGQKDSVIKMMRHETIRLRTTLHLHLAYSRKGILQNIVFIYIISLTELYVLVTSLSIIKTLISQLAWRPNIIWTFMNTRQCPETLVVQPNSPRGWWSRVID
jgi:hypothetical protein